MFVCMPCALLGRKGEVAWAEAGTRHAGGRRWSFWPFSLASVHWMAVGMVEVQSGLQLSCGEWPHRLAPGIVAAAQSHAGDGGRRLHMNVGEGLDVRVDVDGNEPAWLKEGERQEEKDREKVVNSEKGEERTTRLSGRTGMRTHRGSKREWVRQETQTPPQTNRLNKAQQKPANLFMLPMAATAEPTIKY